MALSGIKKVLGIDFETASSKRNSACSVGLYLKDLWSDVVLYENELLINPRCDFCYFNMMINGITPEMVADAPLFDEIYDQIIKLIDNDTIIIAHNASFDMSVLRNSCDAYRLEYPCCSYLCTLLLSRALIPNLASYSLPDVTDYLGIAGFEHHNALADTKACVAVFEKLLEIYEVDSLEQLTMRSGVCCGRLQKDQYWACRRSANSRCKMKPQLESNAYCLKTITDIDEENPLFHKTVVFTGILSGMPRDQAENIVEQYGGMAAKGVTKKTNYLVYGYQDTVYLRGHTKSSKIMKAEKYASEGADIQIINEADFMKMVEVDFPVEKKE